MPVICPECAAEVFEGAQFCTSCGVTLPAGNCPSCGQPHGPKQRFCGHCGAALAVAGGQVEETNAGETELRFVSVLFVDIVGFTDLSEDSYAEDIRALLARYYDTARGIVARYGGVLEKFIGDAVMAVWGVPTAREDDAERAVRTGLEIVDAVAALGADVGIPGLRARAGVVTGHAASMSREGEGLVVGDRVNTAARIQSAANPGAVFVDGVTREATALAIAYEDGGEHVVKGKTEPLHLWHAQRVIGGLGGAGRERGLEAPLAGRDSSLRLLKELFHDALAQRSARLVAISGEAGVGKSRLLWEFDKYADGLVDTVLWHTGRCPSYGEGVPYGALAEMLRQRLGIPQHALPEEVQAQLETGLRHSVARQEEREFLMPRLGVLLGVAAPTLPRAELFAGWRLFLERLAEHSPVVLAFENMQWAEEVLLDFIDSILEWSSASPIFVLALSRPEIMARADGWPQPRRGITVMHLEPLDERAMGELLDGVVQELPTRVRSEIAARAEGIPLYAIETLRVLASRGSLVERDGLLRPAEELGELDVPPTLNSLIAARLDALAPSERRLVKAMAVFGDTFPRSAVVKLGDLPEERIDDTLASLVRKQVLTIRTDPLSPDRGQYTFAQGLLRTVAYGMLSRQERKPRHRAAAEYLRESFGGQGEDVPEPIASHYLEAYRAAGTDSDAEELRLQALTSLRRAAQRAAAVGAPATAERAYRSAAEIATGQESLQLLRSAGEMALQAGHVEQALELFERSAAEHIEQGEPLSVAALAALIGESLHRLERNEDAIQRIEEGLRALGHDEQNPDVCALYGVLGKALLFRGDDRQAVEPLDRAVALARAHSLPGVETRALIDKAVIASQAGHPGEARTLLAAAIQIAESHRLHEQLILAQGSIASLSGWWDLPEAAEEWAQVQALARRSGDRLRESISAGNVGYVDLFRGRWAEARARAEGLLAELDERPGAEFLHFPLAMLETLRGEPEAARAHLDRMVSWERGDDDELRAIHCSLLVGVVLCEGRPDEALRLGREMLTPAVEVLGVTHDAVRNAWPDMLDAALIERREDEARELVALLAEHPVERVPPYLRAQLARGRGLLAALHDPEQAESELARAAQTLRTLGFTYWAARTDLDRARVLIGAGRLGEAEPLLAATAAALTPLGAAPALARAATLRAEMRAGPTASRAGL
jgi:class 3 adenylate cyclase/tetratricopeptide (TPR) repeat protein